MSLDNFSDKELKLELARRAADRLNKEIAERDWNCKLWLKNIDVLLELIPEHSRPLCSDTDLSAFSGCKRCFLLEAKDENYWDDTWELNLQINRNPIG